VVLDVCPQCGGVWLDKGELEKLLSQAREVERHCEEEGEAYHRKEGKLYRKKKGFLELFDLFD
jgi:Zn-finger nucleic acid-binding protein